nr:7563_t:CDS:2 [Entrophospora candida]
MRIGKDVYQDNDKYGLYENTSSNKPLTTQRKRYKSNKEIEELEALSNDSFELFTIVRILNNPSTLSSWETNTFEKILFLK